MMSLIYHITSAKQAKDAFKIGEYFPEGFATEGFIHCSYANQLLAVLDRYFKGQADLVLMEIDRTKLHCRVVDENTSGGEGLYPHIYGAIPISAVVRIMEIVCNKVGSFEIPEVPSD